MGIKIRTMLLLASLSLASCNAEKPRIDKDFDNTGKELKVVVTTYNSYEDLNNNVREPEEWLKGQAHLSGDLCDIKLYEPKTLKEDDEFALTLGHELMHCLYGNYHK